MPNIEILRIKEVLAKVKLGQTMLYQMIDTGEFPKPFKINRRLNGWLKSDVDNWILERAGKGSTQGSTAP
jgi:prophage regulatory protein